MSFVLRTLAVLLYVGVSIWALFLVLPAIYHGEGVIGVVITIVLAPVALLIIPWFNAIAYGDWFLVILNYTTPIICVTLIVLANKLQTRG